MWKAAVEFILEFILFYDSDGGIMSALVEQYSSDFLLRIVECKKTFFKKIIWTESLKSYLTCVNIHWVFKCGKNVGDTGNENVLILCSVLSNLVSRFIETYDPFHQILYPVLSNFVVRLLKSMPRFFIIIFIL